jgi:hypothetical protein
MSISTNNILGNVTYINSINVNVNNNIQYVQPETFYFNSTNKTMTTSVPTTNNVTDFTISYGLGTTDYIIDTYTFTSNPFINYIDRNNPRVMIELRVFTCVTNTGFGTNLYFELYKNNVEKGRSESTYYINESSIDTINPYITILDTTLDYLNINDVFTIKLYFNLTSNGTAYTGKINFDKSSFRIGYSYNHTKGYEYIEKNRLRSSDETFTTNNEYSMSNKFNLFKGIWIMEFSFTFYVNTSGTYGFVVKTKEPGSGIIFNNTMHYYSSLTSTGPGLNHTVKIRHILNIYNYIMEIQPFITWFSYGSGVNVTIRGSNTHTNYIRLIKIG